MIFLDASAIVARFRLDDKHHARAMPVWEDIESTGEAMVTTSLVVAETLNLIAHKIHVKRVMEVLTAIRSSPDVWVFRVMDSDEEQAARWLARHGRIRSPGFIDAVSMHLMRTLRVQRVFTFDGDFNDFGFETIPPPVLR